MVVRLSPLSERMTAPPQLPMPVHPDVADWRPATVADVDDLWELLRALGRADHPNYTITREEVAEGFGFSHVHAEFDTLSGYDANGRVVAHGSVTLSPGQDTLVRSILDGGVHPELRARGIGRQLLAWQIARAQQQLATSSKPLPGWIQAFTDERAPQNSRLFERAGLTCVRYFLSLDRRLDEPVQSITLGAGIRLAPYSAALSPAVKAARDESFRDHWSSQPISDEGWSSFVDGETFRTELSFVAYGTDAFGSESLVGFIMTTVNEDDWAEAGYSSSYINLVGVLRGWRGRHIAQALLAAQMTASRNLGHERVTLDVDSDSPTGALALYTGMGFFATNRELAFTLEY